MNKIISKFFRIFIGIFLIISGLLKVNDTIGFSYKLNEYFQVLHIEFFSYLFYPNLLILNYNHFKKK